MIDDDRVRMAAQRSKKEIARKLSSKSKPGFGAGNVQSVGNEKSDESTGIRVSAIEHRLAVLERKSDGGKGLCRCFPQYIDLFLLELNIETSLETKYVLCFDYKVSLMIFIICLFRLSSRRM